MTRFLTRAIWGIAFSTILPSMAVCQAPSQPGYASDKPLPEPILFGEGVISTAADELNACFTLDEKAVYFCINAPVNRLGVILVSRFEDGKWQTPEVASSSGQYSDYDPFLTPDGSKLFFISNRPVEGQAEQNYDIWYVKKTKEGCSDPENPGTPINTEANEFYPSVSANGTLYFSTRRASEQRGIRSPSRRAYRWQIRRTGEVERRCQQPIRRDRCLHRARQEVDRVCQLRQIWGLGLGDLYISYNQKGVWTPTKHLGEKINSNAREYCPIFSPDSEYFFFTSMRGFTHGPLEKPLSYEQLMNHLRSTLNGTGNIYQVDNECVAGTEVDLRVGRQ